MGKRLLLAAVRQPEWSRRVLYELENRMAWRHHPRRLGRFSRLPHAWHDRDGRECANADLHHATHAQSQRPALHAEPVAVSERKMVVLPPVLDSHRTVSSARDRKSTRLN